MKEGNTSERYQLLSTLKRSLKVLDVSDIRRLKLVAVLQIGLGFLDLIGVATIGILGALAVTGIQSQQPGNQISSILDLLHMSSFSFQSQVAILGASAATILIVRTIFSIIVTRRIYFFLSRRGAFISSKLISKLLSQSLIQLNSRSSQETLFAVTSGVNAITLGVLATTITLIADTSLLLIMAVGLFIVDPIISLTTIIFFWRLRNCPVSSYEC
jgi:ATP-binding cassette, subfamily B, bacterial PglK